MKIKDEKWMFKVLLFNDNKQYQFDIITLHKKRNKNINTK